MSVDLDCILVLRYPCTMMSSLSVNQMWKLKLIACARLGIKEPCLNWNLPASMFWYSCAKHLSLSERSLLLGACDRMRRVLMS